MALVTIADIKAIALRHDGRDDGCLFGVRHKRYIDGRWSMPERVVQYARTQQNNIHQDVESYIECRISCAKPLHDESLAFDGGRGGKDGLSLQYHLLYFLFVLNVRRHI